MPAHVTTDRPTATALTHQERQVLAAVGCGLRDDEIAAALAIREDTVAEQLARILVRLGLRDRHAAIVHAFDCGLVVPGRGPRTRPVRPAQPTQPAQPTTAVPVAAPRIRISLLGPVRAWRDERPLNLGHLRQRTVLAALALGEGRAFSHKELLDAVWGMEPPVANVVPVYVYRLRKALGVGDGQAPVIERGPRGYQLTSADVDVDVARVRQLVAGVGKAERAGEPLEAVRLCAQALELFRGEPLAGLPGPLAELERLRLTERRIALVQRKVEWQLRLGQDADAIAELFALSAAHPLNEPLAATLMRALHRNGRQVDALTVFERSRRRLADDLGVPPSRVLCQARQMILRVGA
ncbi:BTAD domain-containing putative transcriptional regulator [Streptomyces apocyni]|uniref:BTAD domain-containing putative transcriptional regulator n=1 Tax=Streptomyces apocyni TaxID=2654677 RepID=UPI0012EADAE2|nr:BTAD domain-containing putative transcriptional regulator [Streptomyces apocyni]